jgi:hypothetical protein
MAPLSVGKPRFGTQSFYRINVFDLSDPEKGLVRPDLPKQRAVAEEVVRHLQGDTKPSTGKISANVDRFTLLMLDTHDMDVYDRLRAYITGRCIQGMSVFIGPDPMKDHVSIPTMEEYTAAEKQLDTWG